MFTVSLHDAVPGAGFSQPKYRRYCSEKNHADCSMEYGAYGETLCGSKGRSVPPGSKWLPELLSDDANEFPHFSFIYSAIFCACGSGRMTRLCNLGETLLSQRLMVNKEGLVPSPTNVWNCLYLQQFFFVYRRGVHKIKPRNQLRATCVLCASNATVSCNIITAL